MKHLGQDDRFKDIDRAALKAALLQMHVCPHCRADLKPVAFCADVFGCAECKETWHVENHK